MTDWWSLIERYTLSGDWTGLLVCADGLQEEGQEEMARTIRWAVNLKIRPHPLPNTVVPRLNEWVYHFPYTLPGRQTGSSFPFYESDCRACWESLDARRRQQLEFYS